MLPTNHGTTTQSSLIHPKTAINDDFLRCWSWTMPEIDSSTIGSLSKCDFAVEEGETKADCQVNKQQIQQQQRISFELKMHSLLNNHVEKSKWTKHCESWRCQTFSFENNNKIFVGE